MSSGILHGCGDSSSTPDIPVDSQDASADQNSPDAADAGVDSHADASVDAPSDTAADTHADTTPDSTADGTIDTTTDATADATTDATADALTDAGQDISPDVALDSSPDSSDALVDSPADAQPDSQQSDAETTDADAATPVDSGPPDATEAGCSSATDCPKPANECVLATCTAGACGTQNVANNTPISKQTTGDCHVAICDGQGAIGTAVDLTDVPVAFNDCTLGSCQGGTPSQTNLVKGTACSSQSGKVCDGNGACVECVSGNGCVSGLCVGNVCQTPTCLDQVQNGQETDVDCGGGTCPKCPVGKKCSAGNDCSTLSCDPNKKVCLSATCQDGLKNGQETAVDCGGSDCPACPAVLLLGGSTTGILAASMTDGKTWVTSTLSDATAFAPSLSTGSDGKAWGVFRSETGQEVHLTNWAAGTWTAPSLAAKGAITREQPFVDATGGTTAHVVYQSADYHFFYLGCTGTCSSSPNAVGGTASQSYTTRG